MILKLFCTENQLKTNDTNKILTYYKTSFDKGFVQLLAQYLEVSNEDLDKLFIDYMSLCFPPNKVIRILNLYFGESLNRLRFQEFSRKPTKKSVMNNQAFSLICRAIQQAVDRKEIWIPLNS